MQAGKGPENDILLAKRKPVVESKLMRNNAENVSIIIPAYNAERWLARAIHSCLNQTRHALEIIVVDDGSTDQTAQIARGFGGCVKVLQQHNAGQGAARDLGIRHAQGNIVGFLDSDDELLPDMIATLLDLFREFPEVGAVFGAHLTKVNDHVQRVPDAGTVLPPGVERGIVQDFFRLAYFPATGSLLVQKNVLVRIGGFSPVRKAGQDVATWARIGAEYPWAYVDCPVSIYHVRLGSVTKGLWPVADGWWLYDEPIMRTIVRPDLWDSYRHYRSNQAMGFGRGQLALGQPRRARELLRLVPPKPRGMVWGTMYLLSFLPGPACSIVVRGLLSVKSLFRTARNRLGRRRGMGQAAV